MNRTFKPEAISTYQSFFCIIFWALCFTSLSSAETLTSIDSLKTQNEGKTSTPKLDEDEILHDHESTRFRLIVPIEGDVINSQELEIILSLGENAFSSVSLLLDGDPIENPAVTEGSLMTVKINDLTHGIHRLSLVFLDEQSKILYQKEISFFVQLPKPQRILATGKLKQSGVLFARSEFRGTSTINEVRGYRPFTVEGNSIKVGKQEDKFLPRTNNLLHSTYRMKYDYLELQSRLTLNSQENKFTQPFHRYGGRINYGPWASLSGGDVYPHMNDLILKETRIRGGETKLRIIRNETEWANLHYTQGSTRREIEPHVLVYQSDMGEKQDTIPGTLNRKIAATRLGFGSNAQMFSLGFTALKTWDEDPDWEDLIYDSLPRYSAEENVSGGVDFQMALWKRKIIFFTDYAMSLWTANRKAALLGSQDSRYQVDLRGIQPKHVGDYMVINISTLIDPDDLTKNHALQSGFRASLPFDNFNSESEAIYYETGDYYRSEGNPYLTTTGEKGLKILQRLKLLDNKLATGFQGSYGVRELYTLDTATNHLNVINYKGDVRYAPHITLPSVWIGISGNHNIPSHTTPSLSPKSEFNTQSLYLGGFQQLKTGPGKLHVGINYSITNFYSKIYPALNSTENSVQFFESSTHIFASSLQYRRSRSPLIPFLKYSLTSNDVREPLNNVGMGTNVIFSNKLNAFLSVEVGEYPISNKENDLKTGESLTLTYNFLQNHTISFQERIFWNGPDKDLLIGGNYEIYF